MFYTTTMFIMSERFRFTESFSGNSKSKPIAHNKNCVVKNIIAFLYSFQNTRLPHIKN